MHNVWVIMAGTVDIASYEQIRVVIVLHTVQIFKVIDTDGSGEIEARRSAPHNERFSFIILILFLFVQDDNVITLKCSLPLYSINTVPHNIKII